MKERPKKYIAIKNVRLEHQRQVMEVIAKADHCPFCPENLSKYHKMPILRETSHWLLTTNQWPYEHTKIHLVAIHKSHVETLRELSDEAGAELFQLFKWAQQTYNVPGGAFAMRFGDLEHSAGTVAHIHAQFIQPDINAADYEPVRFKIGSVKQK